MRSPMYEVAKSFYLDFLPQVVEAAGTKGAALRQKYEKRVQEKLAEIWVTLETMRALLRAAEADATPDEFGVVPLPGPGGVIHPRGRARRPARAQPWCVVRACACFGRSPALICRAYSVFRFASEITSRIVWRHFRLPHLQP